MNIQSSTNTIPTAATRTRRPWYISNDRMTVPIALPKEIVWARLSEALRRVSTRNGSFFDPRVEYIGRVDGDSIEVICKVGGRTGTWYDVTGELAHTAEGTQMSLAIHENRIVRLGQTALGLLIMVFIYAFLTWLRGSFLSTSTLVSSLVFAAIMSVPMLVSAGWHRDRALTRTAELLKSIAEGRYYETA